MLEIKARELFPDADADLADLEPVRGGGGAGGAARGVPAYQVGGRWLSHRLDAEADRFFRPGPAPIAPRTELRLAPQDPLALAGAIRPLAAEPPEVSLATCSSTFRPSPASSTGSAPSSSVAARFMFDDEVATLTRLEQASAFLALLELRKRTSSSSTRTRPSRR